MSEAACAKEILCDPEINKTKAFANTYDFLNMKILQNYKGNPELLLTIKKELHEAMSPHLLEAEKAGAEILNKYIK